MARPGRPATRMEHGYLAMYRAGCRCRLCEAAERRRVYDIGLYARCRQVMLELKGTICRDCGGTFPPEKLHFHHRNPADKSFGMNLVKSHGSAKTREEAAKCVVVCGPCHTARTRKEKHASSNR